MYNFTILRQTNPRAPFHEPGEYVAEFETNDRAEALEEWEAYEGRDDYTLVFPVIDSRDF